MYIYIYKKREIEYIQKWVEVHAMRCMCKQVHAHHGGIGPAQRRERGEEKDTKRRKGRKRKAAEAAAGL